MKVSCDILMEDGWKSVHFLIPGIRAVVETHSRRVAAIARMLAPKKSGDLRKGIIAPDWEEKSKSKNKIGRQVFMDYRMNDIFVKYDKNGNRWYYPASQEHGFLIGTPPNYNPVWYKADLKNPAYRERALAARNAAKVPGKYFLRTARDVDSSRFKADIEKVLRDATDN